MIASIGVRIPVKLFFEYANSGHFERETLDGIVAMPVRRSQYIPTQRLFPLQHWTHEFKWTNLAIMEIPKLSRELEKTRATK